MHLPPCQRRRRRPKDVRDRTPETPACRRSTASVRERMGRHRPHHLVPLDGAARGSGHTRAPARGATVAPPAIFLRRLLAGLREKRKGEGRGHVRVAPLLTGAGERGEGHGGAAPLRSPVAAASSGSG